MRNIVFVSAFLLIAAASAIAQISDGDQHWAARATGHQGGRAAAAEVDAAIAAYQRAIAQYPSDLEPRWKLLRAIRFKGAYVASTNADKKTIYDMGKHAGEDAVAIIDRQLTAKGLRSITKATEKEVADAARSIPGAAQIFQWDAANWGEWALAYGKLAAVREGAADRIRREATIAMLIDPNIEGGGPARILGRLHDQTPHIPFLTGWASSREAVKFLNDAVRIDPTNKVTRVFLAEAMVNNNSDMKPQAVQMLRELISSANNPEYEVEQAAAQDDARALLKKWAS
jgi:tetratricopeptide (TPR) repeat protein